MNNCVLHVEYTHVFPYRKHNPEVPRHGLTWNVQAKVTPVIAGATGTVSKSLRQYLSNIPGKHEIKELQKTAILCTAHKLRAVLM